MTAGGRPGLALRAGLALDRARPARPARRRLRPGYAERLELPSAVVRLRRGGGGPASPVVVVPDPPNVIEHYDALFDRLAVGGPCAIVEAPGFGFSTPKPPFGFDVADLARLLVELLEALSFRAATLSLACVGAFAALEAAARRPDLVGRLVLSQMPSSEEMVSWVKREDVFGVIQTPIAGQLALALGGRFVARRWYRACLPSAVASGPWAEPALLALRDGARFPLASAFQVFARRRPGLRVVEQPVTLLFGTGDPTHAATDVRSALASLPGARFVDYPRAGHFPDLENADDWLAFVRA